MKHKIQEQLLLENQGLSKEEEIERFRVKISTDKSKFGQFVRGIIKRSGKNVTKGISLRQEKH